MLSVSLTSKQDGAISYTARITGRTHCTSYLKKWRNCSTVAELELNYLGRAIADNQGLYKQIKNP